MHTNIMLLTNNENIHQQLHLNNDGVSHCGFSCKITFKSLTHC